MIDTMKPPSRIGPYTLARQLAAGSRVWLATTPLAKAPLVLKLAATGEREAHARLLHEAAIAGQFDHPNIIRIHETGRAGEWLWLAQAYAPGEGSLTLANFRQLLLALVHVHGNDVVHGDIRPANLLLDHGGELRLANFAYARKVGQASAQDGGRTAYASPEQLRGDVIGVRADMYAAGAVLHEILTRQAFAGTMPTPPSVLAPGLGTAFDAVVARALAPDPAGRYIHVFELLVAFDAACQHGVSGALARSAEGRR